MRSSSFAKQITVNTTRRALVFGAAASAAGCTTAGVSRAPSARPRTYVLVHGASQGGWCWRRVSDRLERRGHKVFTPTLTGLGERSHLMSANVNLDMHITDIVNVLKWESLEDIVLVGHSYGGWVISGVAEQMRPVISSIVFLDAFMPENGQKGLDLNSERSKAEIALAVSKGEVSRAAPPAAVWNVNEKDRAWVDAMCTPHPIATLTDRIALTGARDRIARKTYVRAKDYPNPGFDTAYAKIKTDPAWRTYELPCGHDIMIDMPQRLAEILLEVT